MNAARRRAHRRIVLVLGPLAIAVFAAAMLDRGSNPVVTERLPDFGSSGPLSTHSTHSGQAWGDPIWTREDLFPDWPARLVAYPGGRFALKPLRPILKPDVLLYWSPEQAGGPRLPADAHLLGRIGGTQIHRFALPGHDAGGQGSRGGGSLILYSLGHQQVVNFASFPALGSPREERPSEPSGGKR